MRVCDGSLCLSEWYCNECQVIGTLLQLKTYYFQQLLNSITYITKRMLKTPYLVQLWVGATHGYYQHEKLSMAVFALCKKKIVQVLQEVFFKLDGFKFQSLILSSPAVGCPKCLSFSRDERMLSLLQTRCFFFLTFIFNRLKRKIFESADEAGWE